MPRALVVETVTIPAGERGGYLAGARRRRDALRASGVNHWLFEDPAAPGAFTEFVEARDAEALAAARRALELPAATILREVELS